MTHYETTHHVCPLTFFSVAKKKCRQKSLGTVLIWTPMLHEKFFNVPHTFRLGSPLLQKIKLLMSDVQKIWIDIKALNLDIMKKNYVEK